MWVRIMAKLKIDIRGDKELVAVMRKAASLREAKQILAKHAAQLQQGTISRMNTAYIKGYSTGATARSVTNVISNGGLTATVGPHTNYFVYLEYGTRFMNAVPTLGPAFTFQQVQFINDLRKLVE